MSEVIGRTPTALFNAGDYNGQYYDEVTAKVSEKQSWIARVISKPKCRAFYLMHWVGSNNRAALAVQVMASFEIIEK